MVGQVYPFVEDGDFGEVGEFGEVGMIAEFGVVDVLATLVKIAQRQVSK